MKKVLALFIAFMLIIFGLFSPSQVSAEEIGPGYSFTYTRNKLFQLKVVRAKKVRYTFEYTRLAKGKEIIEGVQGGGKSKKNVYVKSIYAGTQSSKYFIPHTVLRGKIHITATDVNDDLDTHSYTFVISKNKMKIISEE